MNTPMSDTQEKIEEFWGKCFHPATKVVYTTDHYKVGKEEFISIVSGFINQARIEGAIEELRNLPSERHETSGWCDTGFFIDSEDRWERIKQLEQSEESV